MLWNRPNTRNAEFQFPIQSHSQLWKIHIPSVKSLDQSNYENANF